MCAPAPGDLRPRRAEAPAPRGGRSPTPRGGHTVPPPRRRRRRRSGGEGSGAGPPVPSHRITPGGRVPSQGPRFQFQEAPAPHQAHRVSRAPAGWGDVEHGPTEAEASLLPPLRYGLPEVWVAHPCPQHRVFMQKAFCRESQAPDICLPEALGAVLRSLPARPGRQMPQPQTQCGEGW